MVKFIQAALPFVFIGICLVIISVNHHKKDGEKGKGNYLTEGMCLGMCIGVTFSTAAHISMGLGITLGMLIGETIGVLTKKK